MKLSKKLENLLSNHFMTIDDCHKTWRSQVERFMNERDQLTEDDIEKKEDDLINKFYKYHKKANEKEYIDEQLSKYEQDKKALERQNYVKDILRRLTPIRKDKEQLQRVKDSGKYKDYNEIIEWIDNQLNRIQQREEKEKEKQNQQQKQQEWQGKINKLKNNIGKRVSKTELEKNGFEIGNKVIVNDYKKDGIILKKVPISNKYAIMKAPTETNNQQ
jgi:hypothetical protein